MGLDIPIYNNDEFNTAIGSESISKTNDYIALITIKENDILHAENLLNEIELLKENNYIEVVLK